MKRTALYFLTLLFVSSGLWACGGSSGGDAKKALDKLHAACKADDHKAAAGFIAYKLRKDKARRYKDTLNAADEDELYAVKRTCKRLLKKMGGDFEIVEQKTEKDCGMCAPAGETRRECEL